MFSTTNLLSRGLLLAGAVALPLVGGAALAQTTTPAPATQTPATQAPAAAPASPLAADKTGTAQTHLGAMKATPAEKKAAHDKKTVVTKTSAVTHTHHVKKAPVAATATTVSPAAKSSATAPITQ